MISEFFANGQSSYSAQGEIPRHAVFIVGAGHFGNRAAHLISEDEPERPVFVLDPDAQQLSTIGGLALKSFPVDGIHFLAEHFKSLSPADTIVPAVPLHLAYEWLREYIADFWRIEKLPIPETVKAEVPLSWPGSDSSLLVSYADFLCPEACSEPEFCTVTGERRDHPLHDLLSGLEIPGFTVHVIRSRHLAPGLGGFKVEDLVRLADDVTRGGFGKWLLCTACRCHGIATTFEVHNA